MQRLTFPVLLALTAALPACAGDDSDSVELDEAEQASTAVETSTEVSYVTSLMVAGTASLSAEDVDTAVADLAAAIEARLAAGFTVPACATVTTDEATFVELTFDGCTGAAGLHGLSGTVRAEVGVDTIPCGPAQCIDAITYALDTSGVTLNGTTFAGAWTLEVPIAGAGAYAWSGEFSIDGPRRSLHTRSSATVAVDGACATYDASAEITGTPRALTVTADGVTRCLDACPSAGTVTAAGARGTLTWSYHGDGAATVTGAAGATFDVTLACAR